MPKGSSRVAVETKNNQKIGKFKSKSYQSERVLQDMNGDGWCDIWCSLFKTDIQHRSKRIDTDGDGLTDYEEMILMTSPVTPGGIPSKLTAAEKVDKKKGSCREWKEDCRSTG